MNGTVMEDGEEDGRGRSQSIIWQPRRRFAAPMTFAGLLPAMPRQWLTTLHSHLEAFEDIRNSCGSQELEEGGCLACTVTR